MSNGNPVKSLKKVKITGIIIVVLLIFGSIQFVHQYQKLTTIKGELAKFEQEYSEVVAEGENLKKQQALLSDPVYIERVARENLRMIRPDEYLVVDSVDSDAPQRTNEDLNSNELH